MTDEDMNKMLADIALCVSDGYYWLKLRQALTELKDDPNIEILVTTFHAVCMEIIEDKCL